MYEDAGSSQSEAPDPAAVVAVLRAHGLTRLLADPAISARVARVTHGAIGTLTANGLLDSHGRSMPTARLAERVRLGPTDGLLVPAEDVEDLRARLTREHIQFREETIGDHVLFYDVAPLRPSLPCRRTTWRVSEAGQPGGTGVRYTLEAWLPAPQRLVGLRIEHPVPSVRGVPALAVSDDGRAWRRVDGVRRLAKWGWAGRTLLRFSGGADELVLPPTPARRVKVELWRPQREEHPIASLCARGEPLP